MRNKIILGLLLGLHSAVATATCTAVRQNQSRRFGINLTEKALSIAADAPIGTVIYNDTVSAYPTTVPCGLNGINMGFNINPDLVSWTADDYLFAVGNTTGLSFKIIGRQRNGAVLSSRLKNPCPPDYSEASSGIILNL